MEKFERLLEISQKQFPSSRANEKRMEIELRGRKECLVGFIQVINYNYLQIVPSKEFSLLQQKFQNEIALLFEDLKESISTLLIVQDLDDFIKGFEDKKYLLILN